MMRKADELMQLMKQKIDRLVASDKDEKLQPFLEWVRLKSLSIDVPYKPVAVRAFYFNFYKTLGNISRDSWVDMKLANNLEKTIAIYPYDKNFQI
jgi:hypothetical protein